MNFDTATNLELRLVREQCDAELERRELDRSRAEFAAANKPWCGSDLNLHHHNYTEGKCVNCGKDCAHFGLPRYANVLAPTGFRCACGVLL